MRWQDVLSDKTLQDLPYKIELNEYGKIEMSPASFIRSLLQGEIANRLGSLVGGRVLTELAIQTSSGIRVPDVAWGSNEYIKGHINKVFASSAPEVCVEIISPSNSEKEIQEKIQLYIEAGACEVWIVNESGKLSFYETDGEIGSTNYEVNLNQLI